MCFVENVTLRCVTSRYVTLRYEKEKVESTGTEVDVLNCIDCTVDFFPFLKIMPVNREIMGADVRERINLCKFYLCNRLDKAAPNYMLVSSCSDTWGHYHQHGDANHYLK